MKRLLLTVMVSFLLALVACTPASTTSTTISTPKEITLDDASDILNISLLLPSRFDQIDAASEGLSNEDMGLGSDWSEVYVFLAEDPFQLIYCVLTISKSRIEQAGWDSMLDDEYQMKSMLIENLKAGAEEEGITITVPVVEITHPDIGDSAMLGEGYIDSYGIHVGFDTIWFRSNTVYVTIFSLYMSADKVSLVKVAEEIEKRLDNYSH